MRWCRFDRGDGPRYGIVDGDQVAEVSGTPFGSHEDTGLRVPLARVRLLVPVVPSTFYAAGTNFREHITEMAAIRAVSPEFPAQADIGYRANNALIADGEAIVVPADATELVQYEGELVVVIGRRCRRVS